MQLARKIPKSFFGQQNCLQMLRKHERHVKRGKLRLKTAPIRCSETDWFHFYFVFSSSNFIKLYSIRLLKLENSAVQFGFFVESQPSFDRQELEEACWKLWEDHVDQWCLKAHSETTSDAWKFTLKRRGSLMINTFWLKNMRVLLKRKPQGCSVGLQRQHEFIRVCKED